MTFEWDENKNAENIRKHKVSFAKAQDTFFDVNRVILERTNGPKIIVAEGAKVGRESNFHTADCSMITHLITDYSADAETVAYLKSIGVKILFIS